MGSGMSKTLRATCENGVVTAENTTIQEARVLSSGIGASQGVVILDDERADYIPDTTSDLEETIDQTIALAEAAAEGLSATSSAIGVVGAEAGVAAPALAALQVPIDLAASSLEDVAAALEELKGRLK